MRDDNMTEDDDIDDGDMDGDMDDDIGQAHRLNDIQDIGI